MYGIIDIGKEPRRELIKMIDTKKIYDLTLSNGGHTVNTEGGRYAIGLDAEGIEVALEEFTEDAIKDFYESNRPEGTTIGTWINKGLVYLDASFLETSLSKAIELGKKHNQLAIFDLKDNKEIFL